MTHRLRGAAATGVVLCFVTAALTGCASSDAQAPADSDSSGGADSRVDASASASSDEGLDRSAWIGGAVDPVDTTWVGTDSAGEATMFVLNDDHTVDVSFESVGYADPNDTWVVESGVLAVEVYIDETRGAARYTATWDPATATLAATATTTLSNETVTLTLSLAQS